MQYIENVNKYVDEAYLEEHSSKKGFYKIPVFDGIWISKDAKIYSDKKDKFLFIHMTKNGYPTVRIDGENRYVHILLASTFIKKPKSILNPWVNHRNGNKHDFRLTNLEWSTPSSNLLHAFQNGLRSDNKPVLLKDLLNGNVTEFSGLNACCRWLGKNAANASIYLNSVPKTPLYGRYDLIWKNSTWNGFTKEDVGRIRPGIPRPIVSINLTNNQVTIHTSSAEASISTGVCRSEITTRANGKRSSVVKGYKFIWLHEFMNVGKGLSDSNVSVKTP